VGEGKCVTRSCLSVDLASSCGGLTETWSSTASSATAARSELVNRVNQRPETEYALRARAEDISGEGGEYANAISIYS
jgi:hypothetical protein